MISKINEITPIKDGMSKEEAEDAIKSFLSEILSSDKLIKQEDISGEPKPNSYDGRDFFTIELRDNTVWVQDANQGLGRIIGNFYLNQQLQMYPEWKTADTKFAFKNESKKEITVQIKKSEECPLVGIPVIMSEDIVSYSRYVGDKNPTIDRFSVKYEEKQSIRKYIGYCDSIGLHNLRQQEDDGIIIIIDTEYGSFDDTSFDDDDVVIHNNGQLLSKESEELLGGKEFSFPVVDILGEDVFNNDNIDETV